MKNPVPDIAATRFMSASPYSRDNVRKGVAHYLFGRGMSAIAGFFTIILLVRHMDVPAYAAFAAILGLGMVTGMVAGLGMERALTRYIPEGVMHHPGSALARFIWLTSLARLLVMLAIVGAMYAAWPWLSSQFAGLGMSGEFPLALAFMLVNTSMFQLFSAVMQALVQQKILTRILVVQWGGRLLFILALMHAGGAISLTQALWLMALPDGIGVLILVAVIYRYLSKLRNIAGTATETSIAWPDWPRVRRLSLDNYGYNLVAALPQGSSMILLAAAFLAAPLVAAYGFFISLLDRFKQYLPLQFMLNLAEPVLIAGYVKDGDFDRLCHHNRLLYKFNLLLIMPGLAWLAVIAPQLTALLTGGKFSEYAWIFPVLIVQIVLGSHATIVQIIINAVGKSRILMVSGMSALAAMAASIGIVLASGHTMLLVVTPLVYELVNNAVAVIWLRRQGFHYDPQAGFHWKLAAAGGAAWLCADFSAGQIDAPLGQVLLAAVIALSVFGLTASLLRTVDSRDFQTLKSMLRRKH